MKIIHVPFQYYPDPHGGTENYVAQLAREQTRLGHRVVVAAHSWTDGQYEHDGIPVRRYAISKSLPQLDAWGEGDRFAGRSFGRILDEEQPDIVHLHAHTAATFLSLLREAKQRCLPVVYTWHHPATSCARGTLLRWGTDVCDGQIIPERCAACALHARGLPRPLSLLAARSPNFLGRATGRIRMLSDVTTVLRSRELLELHRWKFDSFMAEVDRIVLVAGWIQDVLNRNRVDMSKVMTCGQSLPASTTEGLPPRVDPGVRPMRVAYLGRIDPSKGLDLVVKSIRALPGLDVILDMYGIPQEIGYARSLEEQCTSDGRIRLLPPVTPQDVPALLRSYHVVVVPSTGMEMAPLVVLEALSVGTPVVGTNRGGIAELIRNERDGILVEPTIDAYTTALSRLVHEPGLLARLMVEAHAGQSIDHAAAMLSLYSELQQEREACSGSA